MLRLVLTAEQTKMLATASGPIEVVNSFGHTIGDFTLNDPSATETHVLSPEVLAELRRVDKESKAGSATKGLHARENA
jgi:hypothetical protein